jgi:hypothetical protein
MHENWTNLSKCDIIFLDYFSTSRNTMFNRTFFSTVLVVALFTSLYFWWQHLVASDGVTKDYFIVVGVLVPIVYLGTLTALALGVHHEQEAWTPSAILVLVLYLCVSGLFWYTFNYKNGLIVTVSWTIFLVCCIAVARQIRAGKQQQIAGTLVA